MSKKNKNSKQKVKARRKNKTQKNLSLKSIRHYKNTFVMTKEGYKQI